MFRAAKIHGLKVIACDGEVGRADDLLFDDRNWTIRYLTVGTGGWITGRQVLLSPVIIEDISLENHIARVSLTRQQVEDSPDISTDEPISRQHETAIAGYYGWPMYWTGAGIWGGAMGAGMYPSAAVIPVITDARDTDVQEHGDPDLRSVREVIGYSLAATDGDIGHVADLLVEPERWAIRYMAVGTGAWLPGKKILIPPELIQGLSWTDGSVTVNLDRETIRTAPEWQSDAALDRSFEESLYRHYGQPPYWENARLMDRWQDRQTSHQGELQANLPD